MYQLLDPVQLMLGLGELLFGIILFSPELFQVFGHRVSPFSGASTPVVPWVIAALQRKRVSLLKRNAFRRLTGLAETIYMGNHV